MSISAPRGVARKQFKAIFNFLFDKDFNAVSRGDSNMKLMQRMLIAAATKEIDSIC